MRWESEGFPDAGERDEEREAVAMKGEAYSAAENASYCELGIDGELKKAELWKGASGSPVFVGNEIIAIVLSSQAVFNGSRFKATPTWKLLQEPSFCQALGEQAGQLAWKTWAQDKLIEILESEEGSRKNLMSALKLSSCQSYVIADYLLADDPIGFEHLNSIFIDIADSASIPFLKWLKSILSIIFPTRLEPSIIAAIRQKKAGLVQCIADVPVTTNEGAEAAMAAYEQRPMEFKICKADDDENIKMKAVLSIELLPEVGIDKNGDAFTTAFAQQLIDVTRVRERLPPIYSKNIDETTLAKAAAKELQFLAEKKNRTYYYVYFDFSDDTVINERCATNAKTLSELFPSIIFVKLTGDAAQYLQEIDDYRPLRTLWESKAT